MIALVMPRTTSLLVHTALTLVALVTMGCGYHDLAVTVRDPSRVRVQVTEATTPSLSRAMRGEFERRTVLDADLDTREPRVTTEPPAEVSRVLGIPVIRSGYEATISGDFTGEHTLHLVTRFSARTALLSPDQQLIVPEVRLAPRSNTAWRDWPGRGVTLEQGTLGVHWTPNMPAEISSDWRPREQQIAPTLLLSAYTPLDNVERVERISGLPPGRERALFGGLAIAGFVFTGLGAVGAAYTWSSLRPISVGLAVISTAFLAVAIYAATQALRRRRARPSSIEELVERHGARSGRAVAQTPES
ncbi:MAG: hypothetical protein KF901_06550 [Myxococcales bacterium]|nr:hypothetical protein [Myxococcales bacterium]